MNILVYDLICPWTCEERNETKLTKIIGKFYIAPTQSFHKTTFEVIIELPLHCGIDLQFVSTAYPQYVPWETQKDLLLHLH